MNANTSKRLALLACFMPALGLAAGCGGGSSTDTDTAVDTGVDPDAIDTGLDTSDPPPDTPVDTTTDTAGDTGTDVPGDTAMDGDAPTDSTADVVDDEAGDAADVPEDSPGDAPGDTPGDTPVEPDGVVCLPAWGLINEALPDEAGSDGSGNDTFIEILTAAGVDLTGAVIEGVNGGGGGVYFTVNLAGTVDTDGLFVVSESAADVSGTDLEQATLNLQNGPDSIVLRDSCGNVLDAMGYGTFAAGDVFAGEGTAVAVSPEGQTLSRCPGLPADIDTDDNSADFLPTSPTPGAANPACT